MDKNDEEGDNDDMASISGSESGESEASSEEEEEEEEGGVGLERLPKLYFVVGCGEGAVAAKEGKCFSVYRTLLGRSYCRKLLHSCFIIECCGSPDPFASEHLCPY